MKRLAILTTTLVLLSAATAWSGEERKPGGGDNPGATPAANPPRLQVATGWGAGKSAADWYIESTDKVVHLTDAQKKAIREIFTARDKAMKEFQTTNADKLKTVSAAVMDAYTRQDQEAIAKAQKAYQELHAPLHEAMKKSNDEIQNVLTAEQRATLREHQFMTMVKNLTDPVRLTDEQLRQARAAWDRVAKEGDPEARERALPEAIQKVLTPEQRATIFKNRMTSYVKTAFSPANLTAGQMKQVEAAIDELAREQKSITDWGSYPKLAEKVTALLTDEQKEAMKKPRFGGWAGGAPGAPAGGASEAAAGKHPELEKSSAGARVLQVGPGRFEIRITEGKPGEKPQKPPVVVLSEGKAETQQYWLGLSVLPSAQGLVVEGVAPESPAARAGLKPHDVLVKAGDKPLTKVAELIEAVQKAKETALALEVVRDGKTRKIVVQPAKRPGEGLAFNLGELLQRAEPGKPGQPGAKVIRIPGGEIRVIIGEGAEGKEGAAREEAQKAAQSRLRDRVNRQHELADEAWKIVQKMESLGEDKKAEAGELREKLERTERELRRTFEPAPLGSEIQELREQMQDLRRQMEELKSIVKKLSQQNKK